MHRCAKNGGFVVIRGVSKEIRDVRMGGWRGQGVKIFKKWGKGSMPQVQE